MTKIAVNCSYCKKSFFRLQNRYNEAIKNNWKQYCSSRCRYATQSNRITYSCSHPDCQNIVTRTPSELQPSGLTFCSHSCAASYVNKHRVTKISNSNRLKSKSQPLCKYKHCSNQIGLHNKDFCSAKCQRLSQKPNLAIYSKEVTFQIQQFYKENDRIPFKRERYDIYRKARTAFGSWNKAIKAAGFEPNPVKFAKKHTAKDGHQCDSLLEKIVDNFLYSRNIKHDINVLYPWENGMTADFKVGDIWIEIFGLSGQHKKYDLLMKEKLIRVVDYQLQLISLYPEDVYSKNRLTNKLFPLLRF